MVDDYKEIKYNALVELLTVFFEIVGESLIALT